MKDKTDDLITRFLLGELSEEERSRVEEHLLADNEFFAEVLSAEEALLDQHLRGQLSGGRSERARNLFESSPAQRSDVEFTRRLLATVRAGAKTAPLVAESAPGGETSNVRLGKEAGPVRAEVEGSGRKTPPVPTGLLNLAPRWIAVGWVILLVVCLSLVFGIFYLYRQKRSLEAEHKDWEGQRLAVERSHQETSEQLSVERQTKEDLSRQLEIEKEKRAEAEELVARLQERKPVVIASVLLTPTIFERGGSPKTVTLRAGTRRVYLRLQLDEGWRYARYSAQLTTFDGRRVWGEDSLDAGRISNGRLTLALPPSILEYEDYRIELKGMTDSGESVHVADYVFKVRK